MNTKEKILLIQLILNDINNDWSYYGCSAENRALKAKDLCNEVATETRNDEFALLSDFCNT